MAGPTASPPPPAGASAGVPLVLVTATVKGPPEQVAGFVRRNLRAGADHVLVFVDDADPAVVRGVREDVEAGPAATVVPTGTAYWRGRDRRPGNLNRRQVVNANVANALASGVPRAAWLFHLDLDERLHLDRSRLVALGPGVRAVELSTWEAVSDEGATTSTRYKRRPTADELAELHRRGLVDRPSVHAYFRGHVGKRGIRPDPRVRLRIHHAMEPGGTVEVEPLRSEWLQVLHDESVGYEEFVRKWRALLTSGGFGQKRRRDRVAQLVTPLLTDETLEAGIREERLREVYRRHVADDSEALAQLGLLAEPDPAWSIHHPVPLTAEEHATLAGLAASLAAAPKRPFERFGPPAEHLLRRLHDRASARSGDPLVVAGLAAALDRADLPPRTSRR